MIRVPQVRVVDEEGAQLGVMQTPEALAMAQERGLDLVEVAPMAAPPVVKFLDFGQYKYELTKREKEAKRRQRSVTFKEVRLSPKIGTGDFDTKVHRAIEFLEDGDRIKVTVRFRGRELTHPELGRNMLARFTDRIKEHGVAERTPLLEGKSMHLTVASTHKPKEHELPIKPGRTAEGDVTTTAPAAAPKAAPAAAAGSNGAEAKPVEPPAATKPAESPPATSKPATVAAKPAETRTATTKTAETRTATTKPATTAAKPVAAPIKTSPAPAATAATKKTEPPVPQAPAATGE
jgi:translation initiation factor IF-3